MRNYLLLFTGLFSISILSAQNVHIAISDYHKNFEAKVYSTFQYANASYSQSRPTIIFITTKSIAADVFSELEKFYSVKQEYTDVWILGISDFDKNLITEVDQKIIKAFQDQIIKYRLDNNLPKLTDIQINQSTVFIENIKDICSFVHCRSRK